jgi:hypothetical protein
MNGEPLNEEEIDEIVIAQVDDDEAWEAEIDVTSIARPEAEHNRR